MRLKQHPTIQALTVRTLISEQSFDGHGVIDPKIEAE